MIGDANGAVGTRQVGGFTLFPYGEKGVWITEASGEGGNFPRFKFEKEVCPLHDLTQEHVEKVFRFYGRMF